MVSSGQARVIALTARINDIEFQGQQINQQRTTLANKTNEQYNSLLDMSVPTPPSKSDYTKIVYKGTQAASKFTVHNVLPTSDGKYNVRLGYEQAGLAMRKSTAGVIVQQTPETFSANEYTSEKIAQNLLSMSTEDMIVKAGNAYDGTSANLEDGNTDVLVKVKGSEYKTWSQQVGNGVSPLGVYDATTGKPLKSSEIKDDTEIYVRCNMADLKDSNNAFYKLAPKDSETEGIAWNNVFKIDSESQALVKPSLQDSDIAGFRLYTGTPNGTPKQITTIAELQAAIDAKETIYQRCSDDSVGTVSFKNPDYDPNGENLSIGDTALLRMSDPKAAALLGDSYNDMLTALAHSFPEYKAEEIADKFYVYRDANNTFKFVNKNSLNVTKEQSSVTTYEYDESGTYTEYKDKSGCELKFDTNTGRITEIGIPAEDGTVQYIPLTAEETTDDDAYEVAVNEYEYDKYLYDKRQNDINARLSILQAEDKNLELKLTRLDNERNALNTELEAVKKVVKEGIDKSYKTFNG